MAKSRLIGDQHVQEVHMALLKKISVGDDADWSANISESSRETATFILNKFDLPTKITCKLDKKNPDKHNDLMITKDGIKYPINLFFVQGKGSIQPKNLGAKSFLSKHFLSVDIQDRFNFFVEQEYIQYLKELLDLKEVDYSYIKEIKLLKAKVRSLFTSFDDDSNVCRDRFLLSIRDYCFNLLQETYNSNHDGFMNAFNSLLMVDQTNIITRITKGKIIIEEFKPEISNYHEIVVYKKGRNTIGIQCGTVALTLRFKFENKPDSSIKLATGFEEYDKIADFSSHIINKNKGTIQKVDDIISKTFHSPNKNTSNAVGKCHEAFAYYWMLKKHPNVIQADDLECAAFLSNYLPKIDSATANAIQKSSENTAETIANYIYEKKGAVLVEGIQIVADIYTSDRLNTGDLKISIRFANSHVEELYISLKAIRKIGQKITTKNPGIGTILDKTYFNIRTDLKSLVTEIKEEYNHGLSRQDCLMKISQEIGIALETAPQDNLKRGIEHLLGEALMIITAYEQNKAFYIEHHDITSDVRVLCNTPSKIQNTLLWNNGKEQISLRVKFSSGESHGWSSIKLSSEYLYTQIKN
ncbi:hypothetical protein BSK48_24775 [Paenibacillus odorifer]|uniref:hypothetical protein n=1 Tax=Paenibacillus odorifer TaxID=189426 RepID=UPI00096F04C4|nr:hypothetical protein [Paenibacillus odorifer]OMD64500.1 hypothetical protein BSK48_24775 [Paenibacillus odorifer]